MATSIKRCTCTHTVQDELYGKGMRVMNTTKEGALRCTVCSSKHTPVGATITAKAKAE